MVLSFKRAKSDKNQALSVSLTILALVLPLICIYSNFDFEKMRKIGKKSEKVKFWFNPVSALSLVSLCTTAKCVSTHHEMGKRPRVRKFRSVDCERKKGRKQLIRGPGPSGSGVLWSNVTFERSTLPPLSAQK